MDVSRHLTPSRLGTALLVLLATGTPVRAGSDGAPCELKVAYFGFWCDSDTLISVLIFWTTGCVSLLLALALSGVCCRVRFRATAIAIWLAVWLPLLTTIGMVVTIMSVTILLGGVTDVATLFTVVPIIAIGAWPYLAYSTSSTCRSYSWPD